MQMLSVIPFYSSLVEQSPRLPWANGNMYRLLASSKYLLPFGILLEGEVTIEKWELYQYNSSGTDTKIKELANNDLVTNGLTVMGDQRYTAYTYDAKELIDLELGIGPRYLVVTTSEGGEYYSEVFSCVPDSCLANSSMIMWDSVNFSFRSKFYLQTDIGFPDYLFEEEGETRDTIFFPTKQISYKKYKFTLCVPEFVCDALRCIRMSDNIVITDRYGKEYNVSSFNMDSPNWQDDGFYAVVECEFTTADIIKRTGWHY